MSIVAGEDIVNLRLKDRLKRIDAEIEEKKTILEKKRETWLLKRLSDLEESLHHLEDRKEEVNRLVQKEDKSSANKVRYQQKESPILCSSKIGSNTEDSERGDQWKWENTRNNSFYNP